MPSTFMLQDPYILAAQEDRCAPRTRIAIPAMFRSSGAKGFQTVVSDLSQAGFSCSSINRLRPGTVCWLTLPGLESLQSEIVWWDNSQVGCAFMSMLSPFVHENLIARWRGDGVFRTV
ncbi:MAG: PilZ domain-containing protein [Sphingomonadales bacterium]|nr:PilZ domain-containing protein [Sphingomonadales bacterium]